MNGWAALVCMGLLFVAGLWFQHALGKAWHAVEQRREAKANERLLAANRHPSHRSRMEEGIDFMLWAKEDHKDADR